MTDTDPPKEGEIKSESCVCRERLAGRNDCMLRKSSCLEAMSEVFVRRNDAYRFTRQVTKRRRRSK